jgi:5'-3' exonuclease
MKSKTNVFDIQKEDNPISCNTNKALNRLKKNISNNNTILIIDFSQIAHANFYVAQSTNKLNMYEYMVLNSIKTYKNMFKPEKIILAMECEGESWRKKKFDGYKINRNHSEVHEYIKEMQTDLIDNFKFTCVSSPSAEADDVIAVLTEKYCSKKVVIISGDKDFKQLLKYNNVILFDPRSKTEIKDINPEYELLSLILKGDKIDGIPNIASPLNAIQDNIRQSPFGDKKVDEVYKIGIDKFLETNPSYNERYLFNKKLIELSSDTIPKDVIEGIIWIEENYEILGTNEKITNYLNKNNIKSLKLEDFS